MYSIKTEVIENSLENNKPIVIRIYNEDIILFSLKLNLELNGNLTPTLNTGYVYSSKRLDKFIKCLTNNINFDFVIDKEEGEKYCGFNFMNNVIIFTYEFENISISSLLNIEDCKETIIEDFINMKKVIDLEVIKKKEFYNSVIEKEI